MEETGLCGCGKPERYMIGKDKFACNKYRRCGESKRLRWLLDNLEIDGFISVEKDLHEYATEVAEENNHDEPNDTDLMDGWRRLIDAVMAT